MVISVPPWNLKVILPSAWMVTVPIMVNQSFSSNTMRASNSCTTNISRFGRDTVDGLSAIRELKAHGVEVYFDLGELHSFQPDFELQYSIRAAIAQGEWEDFHDSIVLAMNQKVTDGTSSIYSRPCYGYRKTEREIDYSILK